MHSSIKSLGENSPSAKLPEFNGKILMLGCGTRCNTSMHGVEETAEPPYCINRKKPVVYKLKKENKTIEIEFYRHNFVDSKGEHIIRRYDRVVELLDKDKIRHGYVLSAECYLMDAKDVWEKGHEMLVKEPLYFMDYPDFRMEEQK